MEEVIELCERILAAQQRLEAMDDYELREQLTLIEEKDHEIAQLKSNISGFRQQVSGLQEQLDIALSHIKKLRVAADERTKRIHELELALETIGATVERRSKSTQ